MATVPSWLNERELAEEELRVIVEEAPVGLIVANSAGKITLSNVEAQRLFGYQGSELLGRPIEILVPERFRAGHPALRAQYLADARPLPPGMGRDDLYGLRQDGSEFPADIGLNRITTRGEVMVMASITDVTERKRAEEERRLFLERAQQAQKMESLGVLAGGIAHVFNNIFQTILGHTELARSGLPPGSLVDENLQAIFGATRRASHLVSQILVYSGKGSREVRRVDLTAVVEQMREMVGPAVSDKATLEYRLAPGLPFIRADRSEIQQVIANLVINASEALEGSAGTIWVSTGIADRNEREAPQGADQLGQGRYVFLAVEDTGRGMDEATRLRIFDPFFTTKFMGRGLGLAAVAGIVRTHGGGISVRSELGKGTTFRLLFPAEEPNST
jgi:PAS domain S-box-containing protein